MDTAEEKLDIYEYDTIDNISPEDILIKDRQRKEYKNLVSLQYSIQEHGILQPIVVTRTDPPRLVAGGRRLKAALTIGLETVPVVYQDNISDIKLKELELEENVQREDLTAEEELMALDELHRLKIEIYGEQTVGGRHEKDGWSRRDTAALAGISTTGVSRDLETAEHLRIVKDALGEEEYNKLISGKNKTQLKRTLDRLTSRATRSDQAAKTRLDHPGLQNMIQQSDAVEGVKTLPNGCVDFSILDPPFGVLEDSQRDAIASNRLAGGVNYHDKPEDILKLLSDLAPELYRVMAANSHLYIFCTIGAKDPKNPERFPSYQNLARVYSEAGFAIRPGPLLWIKEMPFGHCLDPDYQYPYCYEGIIFARKGARPFTKNPTLDYILCPPMTENREHVAQKPATLFKPLFEASGVDGGLFLDCFAGSGSGPLAAIDYNMNFTAFELDPRCVDIAKARLGSKLKITGLVDKTNAAVVQFNKENPDGEEQDHE